MKSGLLITVVDPDPDYLGIEIGVWNRRFAGTTWIFAGLEQLGEFADLLAGFPTGFPDERHYEFGHCGAAAARVAGGYCGLRFRTLDRAGHALLEVEIEDDEERFAPATAHFAIPVDAGAIDRFVPQLRAVQDARDGEAVLTLWDR